MNDFAMARPTPSRARAMPRRSPRKPPRVARVAQVVAGMQTPRKAAGPPKRKVVEDVETPMRWRIITAYLELSSGKPRLPRGGMEKLKKRFPSLNLSAHTVQRLVQEYREQSASEATAGNVDLSRKRDQCGGHTMKLTEDLAKELISINSKTWGRLSCKALAGKLAEKGHQASRESVQYWCKALGASRRRRYIKPKLTLRHKHRRLSWAVSMYDKRRRRFFDHFNTCHSDEKFFLFLCGMVRCAEFFLSTL